MNKRTKILAAGFGVVILYAVLSNFIYPKWIKPWFTLDQQIAEKEAELAKLDELKDRVGKAREDYRAWVDRIGSFDTNTVMTDVRDRLNQLIEKHHLEEAKVTPNRASPDRKTGRVVTGVTVTGTGNLESAMGFLKDVSELPHLTRVLNPSFSPATSARRGAAEDRLNIKVPIEVWVLPQNKVVEHIDPAKIVPLESYVRHQGRDYSPIWTGQPFTDYVELQALANPNTVQVQTGQRAALNVSASGGHGSYKYEWAPPEGLIDPASPSPQVDTAEPGNKRYTVTVTDATGHTAQATVTVNITKPVETKPAETQVVATRPPPPPPPTGPVAWPDAGSWEIRMALLQRKGEEREDELMLFNTANQSKKFIAVGDEFNGGTLIYVHQRGGVGLRGGKYSVYPLGMALSNEIPAESAQEYPELLRAVTFHRDAVAELTRKKEAEAAAPQAPGLQVPEGGEEGSTPEVNGKWSPEVVQEGAAEVIEGPMPDPAPADVTAAPSGATGTSGDMPPADSATDSQEKAEKEQTGSSKPPETKRRPTRNRRPR